MVCCKWHRKHHSGSEAHQRLNGISSYLKHRGGPQYLILKMLASPENQCTPSVRQLVPSRKLFGPRLALFREGCLSRKPFAVKRPKPGPTHHTNGPVGDCIGA